MKCLYIISLTVVACISATSFTFKEPVDNSILYPEGYRRWTHIKSGIIGPEHPNVKYRGFNHVYANDKAFQGYESGIFPDGSVIVFDVIEASTNNNYTAEGKRDHMDVMVRDAAKFAATGGWGYAQFEGNGEPRILTDETTTKCYQCHLKQNDHVFSEFRK
ncbi:MAG TPA: cytochrome P460 family protein [Chryseolinea sp.]